MATIHEIHKSLRGEGPPFDPPKGGGDDGGMDDRLRAIEDRLLKLETKSDHFATKDDVRAVEATISRIETSLHRELHAQTWKLIGVIVVLFGGAMAIAKLFHP